MIPQFHQLNEEDKTTLLDAPALIAVLIAGADGKIEEKEINYSENITHFRATNEESPLHSYYAEVEKFIKDSIAQHINTLPKDTIERQRILSVELSKLNGIFSKLDNAFAAELYKSYLTFATSVAKASGGLLGYAAISPEEERLIGLNMINNPAGN